MGVTWRRINERVLQMGSFTSFSGKAFSATSNGRNEAMFAEATEFAKSIQTLQKDVNKVLKYVEAHFVNLRGILSSPTPRIFDEGPQGPFIVDNGSQLLGQGMDVDAIPKAIEEAKIRVKSEVMDPLMEWMEAYKVLSERMKSLESVRLELDSRRRTVSGLQSRCDRFKGTMTTNHKTMAEAREFEEILAHKQEKMARCMSQFQELERTVYNSMYTLVRDTVVLRDYTHSTLVIIQSCFDQAANAYSSSAAPQPINTAVPHKSLPASSKASKKPFLGVFGKLMGRKGPDASHPKDQAQPVNHEDAPLTLPASQATCYSSMGRAQWQQPQGQQAVPPLALPAASAASGTGHSGCLLNKAPMNCAYPHAPDQQLAGYSTGYDDGQDVSYDQHPTAPPLSPSNSYMHQLPTSELHPAGMFSQEGSSSPLFPYGVASLPQQPATHYPQYQSACKAHPIESGWTAEGY